jgi:hypothetical protein
MGSAKSRSFKKAKQATLKAVPAQTTDTDGQEGTDDMNQPEQPNVPLQNPTEAPAKTDAPPTHVIDTDDMPEMIRRREKEVAPTTESDVISTSNVNPSADALTQNKDTNIMETVTLTRKPSSAKSTSIQFGIDGRRGSVKFSKSLFATVPETIEVNVDGLAEAKRKETKEERKARLALQPKKTAAEKLAALEAKVARAKAKLAAGADAPAV